MTDFFLREPSFLSNPNVEASPCAVFPSSYRRFLSHVVRRVKELEAALYNLDEETHVFLKRIDRAGFRDFAGRDRQLLYLGQLSLHWEGRWNDLATVLEQNCLLSRDFKEIHEFKRMRKNLLLHAFEMECQDRRLPSPRHLALQYEAEQACGFTPPSPLIARVVTRTGYTGGTELRRFPNSSSSVVDESMAEKRTDAIQQFQAVSLHLKAANEVTERSKPRQTSLGCVIA